MESPLGVRDGSGLGRNIELWKYKMPFSLPSFLYIPRDQVQDHIMA